MPREPEEMAARHQEVSTAFLELRAMPSDQRARALAELRERDAALHREVDSLLAHDAPDGIDADGFAANALDRGAGDEVGAVHGVPDRIGPYRVLARIGHGGSGQVFLCEQDEPVRRRVAIKVVPAAGVHPELAARFEVERAALEALDHPHVARVLDAGTTSDGSPYLVMNFIDGPSITEHCERHAVPLARRVELVRTVAEAVAHAHQRGIIHRDLKPANVLVASVDGAPSPQVVDFGIAKAIAAPASPGARRTPATLGLPVGTPAYMAPEQTRPGPVDTRADVYGLAAILYELVAGRPPIELDDLAGDAVAALARVRDIVPRPASSVRTGTPAREHVPRALASDLDVVLGKALEKDPARRYATVDRFAEDLGRVLASEPISARAPTWAYRGARFLRRHRAGVAAAAIAVAALGGGGALMWKGFVEARRQESLASQQFEAQVEINRFLTDGILAQAGPEFAGPDLTARQMLDRASARVERTRELRPLVSAAIHHALGEAYAQLAEFDAAAPHLERAIVIRTRELGPDAVETVHSQIAAASLLARREQFGPADGALTRIVERARRILSPDDAVLYSGINDLGIVRLVQERTAEARPLLEEALAGRRRLLEPSDPKIVDSLNNLAQLCDAEGRSEESLTRLLEALEIALVSPDTPRLTILGLENNIGATLQDLDRDREAEPHLRASLELARELLGPAHPSTLTIEGNVAALESELGEHELALEAFRHVIDAQTAQLGPRAPDVFSARHGYWTAVRAAQRSAEAVDGFEELLRDVRDALGADHSMVPVSEVSLAHCLADVGELAEALPHAEAAAARFLELFGADNPRTRGAAELVRRLRESAASR